MRARRARQREGSGDDGVLPLINVVFLLLVFFMVAGRLTAADPFDIDPARSRLEAAPPDGEPVIHVGADGRLALDGTEMNAERVVDAAAALAARGQPARLRIKADAAADTLPIVALLAKLRAAGVTEARLMVQPAAP
jgi:biopolymer transport protein ExbD